MFKVGRRKSAAVRRSFEEARGGFCGASVFGASGKDCGDEDAEGVMRLGLDEFDNGSLARCEFAAEDAIDRRYVFYGHGHIISYLRASWKMESFPFHLDRKYGII